MRIRFELAQTLAMLFQASIFLPELRHPGRVLPAMKTFQVPLDVQGTQGYPAPQSRIEAPIDLSPGLRPAQWMTLSIGKLHRLGIARLGKRQPGPWQLPEPAPLADIGARCGGSCQHPLRQGLFGLPGQRPGEPLAIRIAGEQPVAGGPQRMLGIAAGKLLHRQPYFRVCALQAQAQQQRTIQGKAEPAIGFVATQTLPARQRQYSQGIQQGHDRTRDTELFSEERHVKEEI